jgi:hypothetical protein
MANDDVIVRFGGSLEGLTNAVVGAKETIESLAAPFTGLQSAFAGIGEAIAAAFALDKSNPSPTKWRPLAPKSAAIRKSSACRKNRS